MGCIYSKRALSDQHPNLFEVSIVINVDEFGNFIRDGQIEVTPAGVALYQKDRSTILWPLRSLRRYGWDEELFSFEAGRRAPTGPGIYAFKCDRAQELFNVLQARFAAEENLSNAIRENQTNPLFPAPRRSTSTVDGYLEPVAPRHAARIRTVSASPGGGVRVRLDSIDSCSETQSPSPSTSTPPTVIDAATVVTSESKAPEVKPPCEATEHTPQTPVERNNNGHEYSNGVVMSSGFDLDALPLSLEMSRNDEENANHVYMNVSPGTEAKHTAPLRQVVSVPCYATPTLSNLVIPEEPNADESQHCYANLDLPEILMSKHAADRVVNYAVLDLDPTGKPAAKTTSSPTSSPTSASITTPTSGVAPIPPDSPMGQGSSYVTIDFEKTTALSHSVCPNRDYDREASRKTRHNSTMNLPPD